MGRGGGEDGEKGSEEGGQKEEMNGTGGRY